MMWWDRKVKLSCVPFYTSMKWPKLDLRQSAN